MMNHIRVSAGVAALACSVAASGQTVIWDEALNGDLGELYRYSTPSSGDQVIDLGLLALGTSRIRGTNIQTSSGTGNRFEGDAVRVTVPTGFSLTSIAFAHNQSVGLREFLRMNGASVAQTYVFRTFPAQELNSPNFNVWVTHDLVSQFVPGGGPLGPGEYLLSWDNATFNTTMQYEIDFVVVPAPAGAGVCLLGAMVAMRRRRG